MIVPVILGPTCIGKTSLALEIAKEIGCDILSIDSRQVFKHLDIGTGKYKGTEHFEKNEGYYEISGVKIWGYDFLDPNEELNVLKFCEFSKNVIQKYQSEGKCLIATCGTGFYLDFLSGKIPFNEVDNSRKIELHEKSLEELKIILRNYEINSKIDLENKLRVITRILALESQSEKINFMIENVTFRIFYLNDTRENLYKNADSFVEEILKKGVIEEFQNNYQKYGECKSLNGLIYKEIKEYTSGRILFENMVNQIKFSLHAYIRRQQTYFKKMQIDFSSFDRKDIAVKIKDLF
jgi:tRNA dimethylallyltransferase